MTTFLVRRTRLIAVTVIVACLLASIHWMHGLTLRDTSFLSGWTVFGGTLLLAFLNARKKLSVLPLIDAAVWLQLHIYLGLLVAFVFFLHTGLWPPSGVFEGVLWWSFFFLVLSGLLGLLLSRVLPNRMRERGERVIYERIPRFRAELAKEVEELAMKSVTESGSNAIAGYYSHRLLDFFQGAKNFVAHLRGVVEPINKLRNEMASLHRYLNAQEQAVLEEIEARVVMKDDLDRQYALQTLLKLWLFVHIPLTFFVIVLSLFHLLLVYAFATGTL